MRVLCVLCVCVGAPQGKALRRVSGSMATTFCCWPRMSCWMCMPTHVRYTDICAHAYEKEGKGGKKRNCRVCADIPCAILTLMSMCACVPSHVSVSACASVCLPFSLCVCVCVCVCVR
jgi:hypothetical protein